MRGLGVFETILPDLIITFLNLIIFGLFLIPADLFEKTCITESTAYN
jgi:hypothetical protein